MIICYFHVKLCFMFVLLHYSLKVYFNGCTNLTEESITRMLTKCPKLSFLNFGGGDIGIVPPMIGEVLHNMSHIYVHIYIYTVEQAKFASAYISQIRDLVSHSRSYRTRSIGCLVSLSTTGGDGASVGEFQSRWSRLK